MTRARSGQLGAFLRQLRVEHGLTLRAVADASRRIPREQGAPISHPYLSILESGRPVDVSIGKLLSLAAVYQVSVRELVLRTPEPLHAKLRDDLHAWYADRDVILDPPRAPPSALEPARERVTCALESRARSVRLPLGEERSWRKLIPLLMLRSAMPVLLEEFGARLPQRLGPVAVRRITAAVRSEPDADRLWTGLIIPALDQALFRRDDIPALLVAAIDWWSLDCTDATATCHFAAPDHDARFGYERAPLGLAMNLRSLQAAHVLRAALPRLFARCAPPPGLDTVFAPYLAGLFVKRPPNQTPPGSVNVIPFIVGLARDLAEESSALAAAGAAEKPAVRAGVVAILKQSGILTAPSHVR
jgi:transcriptional regulator with XRE-family HTH domain